MAQSDMSFRSVSVGGGNRVWAVAADGSVWYRTGVSPTTPTGNSYTVIHTVLVSWYAVDRPVFTYIYLYVCVRIYIYIHVAEYTTVLKLVICVVTTDN